MSSLERNNGVAPAAPPSAAGSAQARSRTGGVLLSGIGARGEILRFDIGASQLASADGFVLGRNAKLCHGVINHSLVSKRQARIFTNTHGELLIEDLHATNPVCVNGQTLQPFQAVTLKSRQNILIGDVELSVAIT